MGTWVAIEASADTPASELAAIEAAYAAIDEVDRRMHPHRDGSDIARINSAPTGTVVEIHPNVGQLLRLARHIYDLTNGTFDPCLPTRPGRLTDIELSNDWLICHVPVELDLGGIAKGHAVDRAIEQLTERGCHSGTVNAGGDLRIFGGAQTFLLRAGGYVRQLDLNDAALAVSDRDARQRPEEHRGYYNHCGDNPVRNYAAVVAKTAAIADALTKCVLFSPTSTMMRALRELEAESI
ncbi:MAG TPA: FAD:protein FMN transferase [Steroidobacteraceae bacterium]|nr:FAD:protein FMN transferase [Steroidobacteraceae bacterium]